MVSDVVLDAGIDRTVRRAPVRTADGLRRLQATLATDVAGGGDALEVSVTEACGTVEVGVSGPTARLRLLFDRAELHPAYVRHVVRRTLKRYRASLGPRLHRPGRSERE